jgi:hypothetical protein
MSYRFSSFLGRHDGQSFAFVRFVITGDTNDESSVGESLFSLLKLSHMTAKQKGYR